MTPTMANRLCGAEARKIVFNSLSLSRLNVVWDVEWHKAREGACFPKVNPHQLG